MVALATAAPAPTTAQTEGAMPGPMIGVAMTGPTRVGATIAHPAKIAPVIVARNRATETGKHDIKPFTSRPSAQQLTCSACDVDFGRSTSPQPYTLSRACWRAAAGSEGVTGTGSAIVSEIANENQTGAAGCFGSYPTLVREVIWRVRSMHTELLSRRTALHYRLCADIGTSALLSSLQGYSPPSAFPIHLCG